MMMLSKRTLIPTLQGLTLSLSVGATKGDGKGKERDKTPMVQTGQMVQNARSHSDSSSSSSSSSTDSNKFTSNSDEGPDSCSSSDEGDCPPPAPATKADCPPPAPKCDSKLDADLHMPAAVADRKLTEQQIAGYLQKQESNLQQVTQIDPQQCGNVQQSTMTPYMASKGSIPADTIGALMSVHGM